MSERYRIEVEPKLDGVQVYWLPGNPPLFEFITDSENGQHISVALRAEQLLSLARSVAHQWMDTQVATETLTRRGYEVKLRPAWKDWFGL